MLVHTKQSGRKKNGSKMKRMRPEWRQQFTRLKLFSKKLGLKSLNELYLKISELEGFTDNNRRPSDERI